MKNSVKTYKIASTFIDSLTEYANRLRYDIEDIKADKDTIQYEVLLANYDALMLAIQDIKDYSITE